MDTRLQQYMKEGDQLESGPGAGGREDHNFNKCLLERAVTSSPPKIVVVVASSSLAMILGKCSTIHSPPALFFFFFKVVIRLQTLISLIRPGSVHSGSAS